jgi:hypothetical protein
MAMGMLSVNTYHCDSEGTPTFLVLNTLFLTTMTAYVVGTSHKAVSFRFIVTSWGPVQRTPGTWLGRAHALLTGRVWEAAVWGATGQWTRRHHSCNVAVSS